MNRLDEGVGMLMDSLQASGKAKNTIVVYLGDHGAQFSRGKCSNYEAGLRVPMIAYWPKHIQEGQVRDELVSSIDILPTILETGKINSPASLPGHSLWPLMENKKPEDWREYIFADGTGSTALLYFPRRSVRDSRYKLIHNLLAERENPKFAFYAQHHNVHFSGGTTEEELTSASETVQNAYATWRQPPEYELYDLQEDPYEFKNLVNDPGYAPIQENLKHALKQWQIESHDPFGDEAILARFTAEIDSINQKYPNHTYSKNPDFAWQYLQYFPQPKGK